MHIAETEEKLQKMLAIYAHACYTIKKPMRGTRPD